MKRFFLSISTAVLTFLAGAGAGYLFSPPAKVVVISPPPVKKFDIVLRPLEFDYKPSYNRDNPCLFDEVYLDGNTILANVLQDGFHISHDGGLTWQRMFVASGGLPPATKGFGVTNFTFLDAKKGWAAGNKLITTEDGGITWEAVKIPGWMDNLQVGFINPMTGFVAGRAGTCDKITDRCDLRMDVYKTTDGARTWHNVYRNKKYDEPWKIVVFDENLAIILADGNAVLRTVNGGKTWQNVYEKLYGGAQEIARAADGRLWLVGKHEIMVSDDLGASWKRPAGLPENVGDYDWNAIDFSGNNGIAVSEEAAIFLTRDGGITWAQVTSNLHRGKNLPVPGDPFNNNLDSVHLNGDRGIVHGQQQDYLFYLEN